jgi:benzoylformate decarboxylase
VTIMSGGKALMEALRLEGTQYVFGLPGSTELLFMDALEDYPDMKFILGLHETVCLGMAEGYSRVSGKVGVVNLHTWAGLLAASPALLNAYLGGVPLLVTAGQQDTRLTAQEPHLSGDLMGTAAHYTKWSTEIKHAADIPLVIRRAFKVALQPPTGPVFVALPQDMMTPNLDFEFSPMNAGQNRLRPDREAVAAAAELLAKARNPAIIVEDGISKNAALSEIVKLAELTGARVYQAWMADVNFPTWHPLYIGDINTGSPATREMLKSVDVLVVAGAPLFAQPRYVPEPLLTASTKIVQIDDNPWQIGKNFAVDAGLGGHIKISLQELCEALEKLITTESRASIQMRIDAIIGEKENLIQNSPKPQLADKEREPISIFALVQALKPLLKPGTLVVEESPSYSGNIQRGFDFSEDLGYMRSRGGGSIGAGLPYALGAKLAAPDRPAVALVGDGSALWSIQSLWTAACYRIPVTFIICSNGSYRVLKLAKIARMGEQSRGRYLGMDFNEPRIDFCQMAEALGVRGQTIEKAEDLDGALEKALASGQPNLINIELGDEFRHK